MESGFSQKLIKWYTINKRNLPWRHEKNAYKIWLSEIILQQTQVVQGLSYYIKFTQHFPDIKSLANAPEDSVLKLWQGLGYYSRARNLHAAAKFVVEKHRGKFPKTFSEIRELKGVGDYTAAAIASFAYNLPHAVVDGNVYRVLSRVFGIETPIDSSRAKKEFQQLADELLDKKNPATYNQAIMEFGSQYCKPQNPDCENCVLKEKCFAFQNNRVAELPIKAKKTKIKNRYFNYVVLMDKHKNVLINKRAENDIWRGLYEFYLIESEQELNTEQVLKLKEIKTLCKSRINLTQVSKAYKHILSHQHLYAKFYVLNVPFAFKKTQTFISLKNLENLAFPRLIEKFLEDKKL
ncbi:MAG: A/G-specific adenine glycosylase [Bacteroidetes bacterium]|nr:A/G-specific adenine glycosylase [Bacteroidota bacterium]